MITNTTCTAFFFEFLLEKFVFQFSLSPKNFETLKNLGPDTHNLQMGQMLYLNGSFAWPHC